MLLAARLFLSGSAQDEDSLGTALLKLFQTYPKCPLDTDTGHLASIVSAGAPVSNWIDLNGDVFDSTGNIWRVEWLPSQRRQIDQDDACVINAADGNTGQFNACIIIDDDVGCCIDQWLVYRCAGDVCRAQGFIACGGLTQIKL